MYTPIGQNYRNLNCAVMVICMYAIYLYSTRKVVCMEYMYIYIILFMYIVQEVVCMQYLYIWYMREVHIVTLLIYLLGQAKQCPSISSGWYKTRNARIMLSACTASVTSSVFARMWPTWHLKASSTNGSTEQRWGHWRVSSGCQPHYGGHWAEKAVSTFHTPPCFWKRYVDHTRTALPLDLVDSLHQLHLNINSACAVQHPVYWGEEGWPTHLPGHQVGALMAPSAPQSDKAGYIHWSVPELPVAPPSGTQAGTCHDSDVQGWRSLCQQWAV